MSAIILGTPDFRSGATSPLFQVPGLSYLGANLVYTPNVGTQWTLIFEGTPSACTTAYALVSPFFKKELDSTRGAVYRLIVTTPDDPNATGHEVLSTQFELLPNQLQKDIWEHPKALALSQSDRAAVKKAVKAGTSSGLGGNALTLCNMLLEGNGSRSFQKSQYAFKVTQVVASNYVVKVSFTNVEKIYTTTQLKNEIQMPSTYLISIDAIDQPAAPAGYMTGWLKQAPSVTNSAGNRISIVNEYWLQTWSTWLYDPA